MRFLLSKKAEHRNAENALASMLGIGTRSYGTLLARGEDFIGYGSRFNRGLDVVHAHDISAMQNAGHHGSK